MPQNLQQLIKIFIDIATSLMPILGGIALLIFFWGLIKFIAESGDEKTHREGKNLMVWGLVSLFVMISFLGIVYFFYDDLGFNAVKPFGLPTLPE